MFNFFRIIFSPIIAILDFITKYFKTVVFLTIIYFIVSSNSDSSLTSIEERANLQKIELQGPILKVDKVLEEIQAAKTNTDIKGVLFVVNSPGGSVAPSVELAYAIKELQAVKPVIAYASGVMASGSYYASIWADKIIANPGSMIGSIGVIFQGANVEELMKKIGISTQTIKAGKYKESGTFSREWNEYEKEELESIITDTYDMFITDVARARKLKKENHEEFANAHIFTSRQAKKVGLVDEVGTISIAQDELYKISKVKNPIWTKEDKFDRFIDKIINEAVTNFSLKFNDGLKAY
ncbi:MAG: signal peptide peptidase SppA [Arcobacter sp.]|uniref:signal peptide peptidase SppA n=1 Tax=uncultured Arcobacter sp. TaxID=165434 RepID=UPI000CCA0EDA|nr:signal peptide peptidase SppA [uncultured Arcobacter sp.]PLY09379.1 MAG: signal peptide peptidase SppA [Arcobacter sp.]